MKNAKTTTKIEVRKHPDNAIDQDVSNELMPYITLYGNNELSWSTLQKGMEYAILEGTGFFAFKKVGKKILVLSDPVCHPKDQGKITKLFLEKFPKKVNFWQAHKKYSKLLNSEFGYYTNQVGVVSDIPIYAQTVTDKLKKRNAKKGAPIYIDDIVKEIETLYWSPAGKVNSALKRIEKQNIQIRKIRISDYKTVLPALTDEYLKNKTVSSGEMSFLVREMVIEDEGQVVYFGAFNEKDELLGIGIYNPMFFDKKITGYVSDILRVMPTAPAGTSHAINMFALRTFQKESEEYGNLRRSLGKKKSRELPDLQKFSLGFSALYHIHDDNTTNNPLTTILLSCFYQFGNSLYNLKGLAKFKSEYRATETPVFVCSKSKFALFDVLACYKASNISVIRQIYDRVLS